jgi:hypothetical protein
MRDLRRIFVHLLIIKLLVLLLLLLFTLNLTTVTLYVDLPKSQLSRLQRIQNALARSVVSASKFDHVTSILRSLHWLKVSECIKFKVACVTLKTLQSSKLYLHRLLKIQPPRCTRSSSAVTLLLPPCDSSLKITDRSFRHAAPRIWNSLPSHLRSYPSASASSVLHVDLSSSDKLLSLSNACFLSKLNKTFLNQSYPP